MSEKSTKNDDDLFTDPWLQKGHDQILPEDVQFICKFEVNYGFDIRDESLYFRRSNGRDELWFSDHASWQGLGVSMPSIGVPEDSCLILLEHLVRSRLGFEYPVKFLEPGIINNADYDALIARIEDELRENTAKTLKSETNIVRVARELGLNPRPAGTHEDLWWALCPGRNHTLQIGGPEELFFCRYCKKKGGEEELRAFVLERSTKKEG